MAKTRLLIVDDNPVIRQGLRSLLDAEEALEVSGEASTGAEAIQWMKKNRADVILMDIRMPIIDGIDATTEILRSHPEAKILILTVTEDAKTLARTLHAGARGYLVYSRFDPDELLKAVYAVASGEEIAPSPAVALALVELSSDEPGVNPLPDLIPVEPLTERETEILELIADGRSNADIAQALSLEEKTVKNHITRLYSKLNITSRYDAIRLRLAHLR
ncbi:MAG: response regulator transcription factor [Dehalococcoidia bacterium]|nr:response regulator transcription factor [Dehalococcoidia bacterium]